MISAPIVKPNLFPSSSSPSSSAFLSSDFNQVPFSADGFRSFSRSAPPLQVRCAATKQVKSPAVEEWKTKREVLLQKRVRSVDVMEALRLQKENNFVILDVRPEAEYKEGHPPGAINLQIYRLSRNGLHGILLDARHLHSLAYSLAQKRILSSYKARVESKLDKDAKIIVACSAGGTMKPTQNLPEGNQSRSLIAAYLLVLNGYKNVFHLEGGLYSWFKEGLPAVAEEE